VNSRHDPSPSAVEVSAVQPVEANSLSRLRGRVGVGAFFRPRISNLLDTLLVPAYHFRLDRLLKRMARKKVNA